MGRGVGRIEREFILTSVCEKQIPIKLHSKKREVKGLINEYDPQTLSVKITEGDHSIFEINDPVRVFFSYFGHVMTFETKVSAVGEEELLLATPSGIYKNLERKYERVPAPSDASVVFTLKGTRVVLNFPRSEEYNPAEVPQFSEEFQTSSIAALLREFKTKAREMATEEKITIFRDTKPSTMEEEITAKTGKILYIPSTEGSFPEDDVIPDIRIITREHLEKELAERGIPEDKTEEEISRIIESKKRRAIFSEIYCPVLYHEYAVGIVYLARTFGRAESFDEEELLWVKQFAQVLAYSLHLHGYFKGEQPQIVEYNARIIDISASGLLFAHSSEELAESIGLYTDLDLTLNLGIREIPIKARVVRKFKEVDMGYYGVLFLDINPDDFTFLFEFIYGRAFTDEDEKLWEGGAPPPPMEIT